MLPPGCVVLCCVESTHMCMAVMRTQGNFSFLQDDPRWQIADPICTFIFAILVLLTTKAILRDISDILMERVPRQIDIDKLEQGMLAVRQLCTLVCCLHTSAVLSLHQALQCQDASLAIIACIQCWHPAAAAQGFLTGIGCVQVCWDLTSSD